MKLCNYLFLFLGIALASSCTKSQKADTPERALEKYVSAAFNVRSVEDRQKLLNLSAGDALTFLQRMDDETFRKHFIDAKLEMVSMKTKDLRQEVSGDVSLVYELSYRESGVGKALHTNKKIAYLTHDQEQGEWRIKATKNMKTFIEMKDDLVVPPNTPETTGQ